MENPAGSSRRYAAQYGASLALAHLLAVLAAVAILIPVHRYTLGTAHAYFAENLATAAVLVVVGAVAVAVGGVLNIAPTLRWFAAGREPDALQRRAAMNLVRRQSQLLAATWLVCGTILVLLNLPAGLVLVVPSVLGVLFGAGAAVSISILLAQRFLRPILRAATRGSQARLAVPGVLARLMVMWLLCSALPCGVIVALIAIRSTGWIMPGTASVEVPVLVVSLAAVLVGLPAMILTSRSISDPIHEVVEAMADVEHGRTGVGLGVYERSEIGMLQNGFNRMVAGLQERDRIRDLFGRHVGDDVARRALEEGASLSGDVRDAAGFSSTWWARRSWRPADRRRRSQRCSTTSSGSWSTTSTNARG